MLIVHESVRLLQPPRPVVFTVTTHTTNQWLVRVTVGISVGNCQEIVVD